VTPAVAGLILLVALAFAAAWLVLGQGRQRQVRSALSSDDGATLS
jgi:hypothetical protein